MTKSDVAILTYKNDVEKPMTVTSPDLPENVIGFKYVRFNDEDTQVTNYRIGIPINKPVSLTVEEREFDLKNNGNGQFAFYLQKFHSSCLRLSKCVCAVHRKCKRESSTLRHRPKQNHLYLCDRYKFVSCFLALFLQKHMN